MRNKYFLGYGDYIFKKLMVMVITKENKTSFKTYLYIDKTKNQTYISI